MNWRKSDRLQERQIEEVALLAAVIGVAFMMRVCREMMSKSVQRQLQNYGFLKLFSNGE